ncbi:hypothetical protein [Dendronalium sp. ChiSLP03b]|nr:hypothetical protein [Dendronalium sp. ChiSLP03b]
MASLAMLTHFASSTCWISDRLYNCREVFSDENASLISEETDKSP